MIADRNKNSYHNVYDSAKSAIVTPKSGSNYSQVKSPISNKQNQFNFNDELDLDKTN